jgi:hypothetical protein
MRLNNTGLSSTPNQNIQVEGSNALLANQQKEVKQMINVAVEQTKREIKDELQKIENKQTTKMIEFLGLFATIISFIILSGEIVIDGTFTFKHILVMFPFISLSLISFVLAIKAFVSQQNFNVYFIEFVIFLIIWAVGILFMFPDIKNEPIKYIDKKEEKVTKEIDTSIKNKMNN